jgi:hypothetical protein
LLMVALLLLSPVLVVAVILFVVSINRNRGMNPNLRPCPDCNQPVSIHASSCPHCGCQWR